MNQEDHFTEDEITFLLKLRPSPTPPVRRNRLSVDLRSSQVNGWDVVVERQEATALHKPSAPPQEMMDFSPYYRESYFNSRYQQELYFVPPNLDSFYPPKPLPRKTKPDPEQRGFYQCNNGSNERRLSVIESPTFSDKPPKPIRKSVIPSGHTSIQFAPEVCEARIQTSNNDLVRTVFCFCQFYISLEC